MLKNCICLIGNSSSGIIEAPSLGIYTINIGDRQKGRISGNSVINVRWNKAKIVDAIKYTCKNNLINPKNPYLKKGNIAKNYYLATKRIIKNKQYKNNSPKEFYDISIRD